MSADEVVSDVQPPFSVLQSAPENFQSRDSNDLIHTWVGRVPLLSPTTDQYKDFPLFLQQAQALDRHNTGVDLVNCLLDQKPEIRTPLPRFASRKCLRYEIEPREKGVFEITPIFCNDVLKPVINSSTDSSSAAALIYQIEKPWENSKLLGSCRYLPDIDIKTSKQRQKAGFSSVCTVWPNVGDKLISLQSQKAQNS